MPTVSVIIPTHNRSAVLKRTLDALAQQNYPLSEMEVIVAADGCTDDTSEMLKAYQAPYTLKVIEQPSQGPAVARNQGAALALAPLLIFLDDDIEASPGFVAAHVQTHQKQANQVVLGYLPTILKAQTGFFRITLRGWWEAMFQRMRQPGYRFAYCDLLSGNFSVSADLFAAVGKFDPQFRCHEDYELGMRLLQAKAKFTFAEAAMGYHHELTDLDRSLRRKYQEGKADVQLGQKYPELKPTLLVSTMIARCSWVDRMALIVIFKMPALGDLLAKGLRRSLDLLEWMRLRSYWRTLLDRLLGYWYLRGIAEASSTQQALTTFLQGSRPVSSPNLLDIEIDLKAGLAQAECRLEQERPTGVRLHYGKQIIGRIPAIPGTERLHAAHLRPTLATTLAPALIPALVLDKAVNVTNSSPQVTYELPAQPSQSPELVYVN
ncbi:MULTISPECIES: glycosyltransferase family 2 protein [Trichocoleus]|uniref:Glycosyltransferase family 2 protein n=1 Tax=Trichocoleus desertorum GB2-A4 TaxID=2933944 RepID=A0ABV0J7V0_9CYAN|nr:glycosyltransferase family A protein [Trichocoleus sp. FACHB-46]MBD1862210.1 glycosyltransferase family 2 protein [Trichocoleus sp. FACHB-46]